MKFTRINPVTGQTASEAEAMKPEAMAAIAERAAAAFPAWSGQGPNARRAVLMKAAAALEARKDETIDRIPHPAFVLQPCWRDILAQGQESPMAFVGRALLDPLFDQRNFARREARLFRLRGGHQVVLFVSRHTLQ